MNASPFLIFSIFLVASCATDPALTLEQKFNRADVDGDGLVSRDEATDLMIGEAFGRFDTNRDGIVDAAEYLAGGGKAEDFKKMDVSGSGKLTLAQAQASPLAVEHMAVPFDEADVNGDGAITYEELVAYRRRLEAVVR